MASVDNGRLPHVTGQRAFFTQTASSQAIIASIVTSPLYRASLQDCGHDSEPFVLVLHPRTIEKIPFCALIHAW